ncbi:MAG: hypothetical protein P4N41_17975 [Negativicutes bacterium]|nr:hypothetical protein [Negativicutes bacterium]
MDAMTELIKTEADRRGITYDQLAKVVHVAKGTVGSWFSRGFIPAEIVGAVVKAIGTPRLMMEYVDKTCGNLFASRYLDRVDDHPLAAMEKAGSIIRSWDYWAVKAKDVMLNKPQGYQFNEDEDAILKAFEDKSADLITVMKTVLIRGEERYGRQVSEVTRRHVEKLEARGYCTPTKEKDRFKAAR